MARLAAVDGDEQEATVGGDPGRRAGVAAKAEAGGEAKVLLPVDARGGGRDRDLAVGDEAQATVDIAGRLRDRVGLTVGHDAMVGPNRGARRAVPL